MCSKTCGGGWRTRNRVCSPPLHGGRPCSGEAFEIGDCRNDGCVGKDHIIREGVTKGPFSSLFLLMGGDIGPSKNILVSQKIFF